MKMHANPRIDPEFKLLIPPLSEDEYRQLEQNILSRRQCRDAIVLWDGLIIDGHNRFYICVKHGIQFEIKELSFASRKDAKLWIVENQLGRRNLTDAMRIELALVKADMLREKAKENLTRGGRPKKGEEKPLTKSPKSIDEPVNVRKSIADDAKVGEGTLYRYMRIREDGGTELLDKVKNGEIKIGSAYQMLTKEIEKRLKQADKWYAYIADRAPFNNDDDDDRNINNGLIQLTEQLQTLLEELKDMKGEAHDTKN